ncbi:hypothetical protein M405DRAFT_835564 [Rhizopogon salebrosus TDB-379]|nr:hypothetical protein M405DRAFT_835564 [Rhizopogon salebrosus TDB-379]
MHPRSVMTGLTLEGHPGLVEPINYFAGAQIEKAQDVREWCVRQWRCQGMVCWWRRES